MATGVGITASSSSTAINVEQNSCTEDRVRDHNLVQTTKEGPVSEESDILAQVNELPCVIPRML